MSYLRTIDELTEAASYGCTATCKVCGDAVPAARAFVGEETGETFCCETHRDRYEAEYAEYIVRECARAAREFRSRTPEQARRVTEWNVWADAVNARA